MSKPDVDDLIKALHKNTISDAKAKHALYNRLAAEAVDVDIWVSDLSVGAGGYDKEIQAVPLSKLKAIMEIKDGN